MEEAEVGTRTLPAEDDPGDMTKKKVGYPAEFWSNLTRRDLKHFRKFVSTTATHGVRRMFTGKSRMRRLFWIALFLMATIGCAYNISVQIAFLASSPTTTEVTFERKNSLPFPAVTICNQSPLNQTALEEKYSASLADFFSCAIDVFYSGAAASNASTVLEHIETYCKERANITSADLQSIVSEILEATAFEAEKFIVSCSYRGDANVGECSYKNFTPVATNNGICYTFNQNFIHRCTEDAHTLGSGLRATGAGQRFALSVWVNIDQADYPMTIPYAGALIELHQSGVPPRPLQLGFSIPPGQTAFAGLQYRRESFSKCARRFPLMDFYDEYTISTCVLNNLYSRVAKKCECIPPGAPTPCPSSSFAQRNITACTLSQMGCYFDEFLDISSGGADDDCEQECSSEGYTSTISYASFPATMYRDYLNKLAPNNTPKQNLVALEVYFEDLVLQHVDEQPAYDPIRLLADIGGQLGLFLGVSVLSVTEFLTWILDEVKDRLLFCKAVRLRSMGNGHYTRKKQSADVELTSVRPMNLKAAELEQEKSIAFNSYAAE